MAGYSGTPLVKKLGLKPGHKMLLVHPPANYYALLGEEISDQLVTKKDIPDFVHLFAENVKQFESEIKKVLPHAAKNPLITIWVSWYKKSSGIPTDLTEEMIRNFALRNKLVDVKVCAVSEQWSGLKLVVPLKFR